jgi:hypothetical protein
MLKSKIVALNTKQAEVYEELITQLEKTIPTLEKFNNKVVNVRLVKALDEVKIENNSFRLQSNYNNLQSLNIYNNNRSTKCSNNHWHYISDNQIDIELTIDDSKRLNISHVKEEIEKVITRLEKSKEEYLKAINDIEKMEKEHKEIQERINNFRETYHYSIREDKRFY